jgi:cysteine desulfurase
MRRIYLDYAAATPIDKRVSEVMKKAEKIAWGNAASLHQEGIVARNLLEQSRTEIANILNCRASEVYFTSGGTESANIAVSGIIKNAEERGVVPHVIVSSIEHSAILESIKNQKIEISLISPDEQGIINPESIKREMKENTVLVCLMHANNEIGTLQPVSRVAQIIKEFRKNKSLNKKEPLIAYPYLLVDASQSALYENISIDRLGADILIFDGIKIYGPRGAGVLVIKQGIGISPTTFGGGQEKGVRPGTENVVSALGLAEALKIANKMREKESARLTKLRDYAITRITLGIQGSSLNGDPEKRLPNNINICFSGTIREHLSRGATAERDSEFLVIKLDTLGFSVSSASACSNLNLENSSYVLKSLGKPDCAACSLRFTLGRETKKSDLDELVSALKKILQ